MYLCLQGGVWPGEDGHSATQALLCDREPCTVICICVYRVVFGPEKMVTVPPRHYCVIENPVLRNDKGDIVNDKSGQAKLQHADQEIRFVH